MVDPPSARYFQSRGSVWDISSEGRVGTNDGVARDFFGSSLRFSAFVRYVSRDCRIAWGIGEKISPKKAESIFENFFHPGREKRWEAEGRWETVGKRQPANIPRMSE